MRETRVAQVIGKWLGGGVESVVMNYYRNIDRDKIQFDFVCDNDSTDIPREEIERLGGRVILVPPYQDLINYEKELQKIFRDNKYEIVHSHINTLSVFPLYAAKRAGVPIRIAHSHSTTNKKEWKKHLMKQMLRPWSKVFATDYIACGEYAGRWLFGDKVYDEKVTLLHNAIDLSRFKYNSRARKKIRKELEINDDAIAIGHIGRFVAQKNQDFLIDIFEATHKQNPKTVLIMVGQGPDEAMIMEKVKRLGLEDVVKFLGQRSDVDELYSAFDILVLPSLYEGLAVVGVEAQACGLPCLFSDAVTKEMKITNDVDFFALDAPTETWAKKILDKVNQRTNRDTYDIMTENGYNIKREAKGLEKIYVKLLNKYALNES